MRQAVLLLAGRKAVRPVAALVTLFPLPDTQVKSDAARMGWR